MSHAFQRELTFLGIESSPSFVRVPEGNGVVERFIRTLKELLLWVRIFDTVEELRQALLVFKAGSASIGCSNGMVMSHLPKCVPPTCPWRRQREFCAVQCPALQPLQTLGYC